jgi:outer membrane protein assembly factor BamB
MNDSILIIGIGGHAVGIDTATGAELWRTKLKGGDFVTVHEAGPRVLAGAGGELFCLETTTGRILWKNKLKGLGTGLITFMSSDDEAAVAALAKRRAQQAAAGAAAAS